MKTLVWFGFVVLAIELFYGGIGQSPPVETSEGITESMCQAAGGYWNECGSACRNCTMNCVAYCECGGLAGLGCPSGYTCTDFPEGSSDLMGICKKG